MCVYDIFVPYAGALVEHPSGLARSAAVSPEQLRSAGLQFSSATLSGNFEVTGPQVILDLCCLKTHKLVLLPEGKSIHVFFFFSRHCIKQRYTEAATFGVPGRW